MYFLSGGEVCLGWKDCFAPLAMTQDDRRPDDQTTKVVTTNARNDNLMCAIKVHSKCHCEGLFRSNLPLFIKKNWLRCSCAMNFKQRIPPLENKIREQVKLWREKRIQN